MKGIQILHRRAAESAEKKKTQKFSGIFSAHSAFLRVLCVKIPFFFLAGLCV